MNSLSWFLYAAEIFPNLGSVLAGASFISLFMIGAYVLISFVEKGCVKNWILVRTSLLWVSLGFGVACFIPSKELLYLIAASEAGEAVVTSEQGQSILNDVQTIINLQLKEMKGE